MSSQHVGNSHAVFLDDADTAQPVGRRRAEGGTVDLALVSLGEVSHGGELLALRNEGEAAHL